MDYKKLGTNIMLFGVGFVGGYFLYTGLFKQSVSLPITMPPQLRWGAPDEEVEIAPPTPLETAQENPQAIANALLYMQA